jgi:hypothetical protein
MAKKTNAKRRAKKDDKKGRKMLDLPAKRLARGDADTIRGGLRPIIDAPDRNI